MAGLLQKIFGKKAQPPEELPPSMVETAPLNPETVEEKIHPDAQSAAALENPRWHLDLPQLVVGVGQSVGKQRDHNEDALFTLTTNLIFDSNRVEFGLFIVADGMGGHQHGEIASGVAVRSMAEYIIRKLYVPLLDIEERQAEDSIQEILQEGVQRSHQAILNGALGGGTTLTTALILGNQLTIGHVGDSRGYIIHADGHMQILTHDHSLVKRLEELGQITSEEAAVHPQRNVLYRALGQGEPFDPDVATFPMPHEAYLLLCSDGLWGVVSEREIFNLVTTSPDPQQACQALIDAANAAGGPDNISVILVQLPSNA